MPTAIEVARYFLSLAADEPEPEPITNLRLQKLLYYAQGLSLAYRDRILFPDRVVAWRYGPVVHSTYSHFADYRDGPIAPHEASPVDLTPDDADFIASVWEGYRRFSASELCRMTHNEDPWKDARRGLSDDSASRREITVEALQRFFGPLCDRELRTHSGVSMDELRQGDEDVRLGRTVPWEEVKKRLGRRLFD